MSFVPGGMAISAIPCMSCNQFSKQLDDADFDEYFHGSMWVCPSCMKSHRLWPLVRKAVGSEHTLMPGAIAINIAKASIGKMTIYRDKSAELHLSDMGVPDEAKVLGIFLTPNGGEECPGWLIPALQTQALVAGPIAHDFYFHSVPVNGGAESMVIAVLCNWIDPASDQELVPLLSSVEAYSSGNHRDAIVPASVAVENKLGSVMSAYFSKYAGKKKVAEFLQDAATFSYQLSPLLPAVMATVGAPALPAEVQAKLSWLRGKRNKVAHSHVDVGRDEAADAVTAALFGIKYLTLYGASV